MGFTPAFYPFNPSNTATSDFVLQGFNNPGLVEIGAEVSGGHIEFREVTGQAWVVANGQFSQSTGQWLQTNSALPSYALVLAPGVGLAFQFLQSAALGGTLPIITWSGASGPVGKLTAPTVPMSNGSIANYFGIDCSVYINSGGHMTDMKIGGVSVGWTSIPAQFVVRVPAEQTISLTYTVATPTWTWFGG